MAHSVRSDEKESDVQANIKSNQENSAQLTQI